MKKKKILWILVACAVVIGGGLSARKIGLFSSKDSQSTDSSEIYVSSLKDIMGVNLSGTSNVYMGIVEGQETTGVNKSSEREVDRVFVSVGDTVAKGDSLFSYKTDSLQAEIVQYQYDIQGDQLQIDDYNRQIAKLNAQLKEQLDTDATKDKEAKEDIRAQIQSIQTSIAISQNSIDQTNAKIAEDQKQMKNSTVTSPADGVITAIATENDPNNTDGSYITILASGDKRVKGSVNEQNVWNINVGAKVTLRSRVDKNQTWTGTISKIDTESTVSDTSMVSVDSGDSDSQSTSYPFYVELDDSEGLMMGQHLYIEISEETESTLDYSKGVYVYDYYVCTDEDGSNYVWVANSKGRLEKRAVTLGDYHEDQTCYEVTDGLSYDDLLAYPMEDYTEGMKVVTE